MTHATHNPFYYLPLYKAEKAIDAKEVGDRGAVLLDPSISRSILICWEPRLGSATQSGPLKELGMDR